MHLLKFRFITFLVCGVLSEGTVDNNMLYYNRFSVYIYINFARIRIKLIIFIMCIPVFNITGNVWSTRNGILDFV